MNNNLANDLLNFFKTSNNTIYINYISILSKNNNTYHNLTLLKTFNYLEKLKNVININDISAQMH